ncbi:hypothetical protein Poly51_21400 [Rubripirellula tenax]|uniref:AsmA-like C-terminal domain-containing protein n=1 Tax=Rubripirellula tenax TaxID=2528015 RepID=A0A5C6FF33_9BACT|nr:hypothetical protein [Rubripirellula tenax]TWU59352.1 hypothetical protein Poly51_21400 [Rubripirellula tenax]
MHERTQRAMARMMFVFCCAVPTSISLTIIVVMATPWYARRVKSHFESELSRDTGLVVQIGTLTQTAPTSIRIDELRLIEPETSEEVAYVRQLDWVNRPAEVSILLHQPKLHSRTLPGAWRLIHDRFLCRPEHTGKPIRFAANDLTIADGVTGGLTMTDVDAWIEPTQDAVEASIQGVLAQSKTGTPIGITFRRDRSGASPATDWTVDTHDNALPCTTLAKYVPGPIGNLGNESTFAGSLRWHLPGGFANDSSWWIDIAGDFSDVALDQVFEKQSHRWTGRANIHLDRCRFEPGTSIDVAGTLRVGDGQIGRSLLAAANRNLGFELRLPEGTEDIPFDRIAMRFSLNDTQLRLDGICHTEVGYTNFPGDIVMHSGGYPMVRSGPQTLPSIALVSALAPSHSVMVPVAGQNAKLIEFLIPPSRPMPADPEAMRARIQTARDWSGGEVTSQPY